MTTARGLFIAAATALTLLTTAAGTTGQTRPQPGSTPPETAAPADEAALARLRDAARTGDVDAQINLAYLHYVGLGVPQDDALASEWLRKAADQGDARAEGMLGSMYEQGRGGPQDRAQAVQGY